MGRHPIDCCAEPTIFSGCYHHIQEGHGSIWLGVFTCKLNMMVSRNNVFQKLLFVSCFDDCKSVSTFGERKAPSPIYDHYNITGHKISIDNFSIVGREDQNLMRTIKEALYIRVNNPSLNRNIGKYHLPHIWDEVLFNTSELKLT